MFLLRCAALLLCAALHVTHSNADASDLGLETDRHSMAILARLAFDFPGVVPLHRLSPGAGTHAVFVVQYPDAPGDEDTAVVKVIRGTKNAPWTEAKSHAAIAAAATRAGAANAVPMLYGVADLSVSRPRVKSRAATVAGQAQVQQEWLSSDIDTDGKVTRAILMQHLEGYVSIRSLPALRPEHLQLAAEAVERLHSLSFEHGDLHFGNILVKEADGDGESHAAVIDFMSAKRWVDGPDAPSRVEEGIDGVPIIAFRGTADTISLATEDLDQLRAGTTLTRREALDDALAKLRTDSQRALFSAPIQCKVFADCQDFETDRRRVGHADL